MGRSRRPKPIHLASKLRQIRQDLGLTQEEMVKSLNYTHSPLTSGQISEFENDKREPPVQLLLSYARTGGIALEYLVDDELSLPQIHLYPRIDLID
ncbi:MAG: helix-turn-helix transcriptional regulator [Acidobacteria bacterium]|nr:helix-turn-helix transcriptional regulator [Acidobacteriota bacterium]